VRAEFPLPDLGWEPTREFWAGARRGELLIPRCAACGTYAWYPVARCRRCGGGEFAWTRMSGHGRLFSWVVVRRAFLPAFADQVPFVAALVALDEDPAVRLATRLVDCDPETLAFDLPVRVVFRPLRFPTVPGEVPAPMFVPVDRR